MRRNYIIISSALPHWNLWPRLSELMPNPHRAFTKYVCYFGTNLTHATEEKLEKKIKAKNEFWWSLLIYLPLLKCELGPTCVSTRRHECLSAFYYQPLLGFTAISTNEVFPRNFMAMVTPGVKGRQFFLSFNKYSCFPRVRFYTTLWWELIWFSLGLGMVLETTP